MKNKLRISVSFGVAMFLIGSATAQVNLNLTDGISTVHIFPTVDYARSLVGAAGGVLVYHGGPVMANGVSTYAIFWLPSTGKLQNGAPTSLPPHYQTVQENLLAQYPGHGIDNNNTQYYETINGAINYIQNKGGLAAAVVDRDAYPASGCNDSATPGNCITDAQIRSEISKVMTAHGWTGGLNKMFLLFTSSGEGSCFNSTNSSCAYVQYCAYHGDFYIGNTPVIYGNEPFGNTSVCQVSGTPSPNNDRAADTAATAASHELTEAMTDPLLNAWFTSFGEEIGDLCAYNYGANTWDSGLANQMWGGYFFELQQEYDNHHAGCVQVGPFQL